MTIIELNHEECLNSACVKSGENLKIWNSPMEEAQQRLQTTLEQVDLYLKGLQWAGAGP